MSPDIKSRIFEISTSEDFLECALEIFRIQSAGNRIYREFTKNLKVEVDSVSYPEQIPFLPVEFFKNHRVVTGDFQHATVFESSGTTGNYPARHYIADPELYEKSFLNVFRLFYGDPEDYLIAAMLPSYTGRRNSSLLYMMDKLIGRSRIPGSSFYRDNTGEMLITIDKALGKGLKVLLMGVSFALLDLAEKSPQNLNGAIIMETGGMKGRRKEITRQELHSMLKDAFKVSDIHSEYGMTELLSQAYSAGGGIFICPPWMKVLVRDTLDPLSVTDRSGASGGINIIDLANIHSCSFIATGDFGKLHEDGTFEVLGRLDNSDIRGCNLLLE